MAGPQERSAQQEAAAWLVRLQSRSISTAELEDFAQWRRDPANAEAYRHAEMLWEQSAQLSTDPDIEQALKGGTSGPKPRGAGFTTRPRLLVASTIVAFVGVVTAISLPASDAARSFQTAVGERSSVRLSDGSEVQLDTKSAVETRFTPGERRIALAEGQAFFNVAHAPDRPFVVDAGQGVTITAVGTQFDVRRAGTRVLVALVTGSVVVRQGETVLARMVPGSVIEVTPASGTVATPKTIDATGWRSGHLTFRDTPLVDAVAEVNRYTDAKLRIQRADVRAEPVSGEFSTDNPEDFRRAVNALLGEGTLER